jgi:hypothetical protein
MKKRKGFKAWLVTWEWSGDHAKPKDKIVEILDPRIPPERVRQIVELLYHREASLREKVAWRLRKRRQPYAAEFTVLEGVQWTGEITCGHNPWLRARLVDNLIIETAEGGKETASWDDRYSPHEMRKLFRRIKAPSPRQ